MESDEMLSSSSPAPPEEEEMELGLATTTSAGVVSSDSVDNNNASNIPFRVKLYCCSDEGQWIDRGTGHVACCKVSPASVSGPPFFIQNSMILFGKYS
jgi:hypothetical protein